jgi:alanyl-tRNA synthetase
MNWTTRKVRATFLAYFDSKAHQVVPSAPIVIKDDPTLMFTNAGMNQFKSVFVGNEVASEKRVADTQKCLRVSGKHNDLEEVGRDHYHHTMFEMLGNWSFGDYFKKDAIQYAWDLLVRVYGIDPNRMYVTIFGGDDEFGVALDQEARDLWRQFVPDERILAFGRKDNFWEMGETGPCGPCSEIHVDLRSEEERASRDGAELVNQDDPEVIEIWNLVFMQFNRLENGSLVPLKEKHIDTGMGLERLVRVLQGVKSNYDTDVFKQLIARIEQETKQKYQGGADLKDVAFRVIADHVRAISFCITDGQLPSNTGAGYVIRRVLRRAIRYGFSQLGMDRPFICKVADELVDLMGQDFPELERGKDLLHKVIAEEEASFLSTLAKGLERLQAIFEDESQQNRQVEGAVAFELYDTFGFPIDLTQLIAEEQGWSVDMNGFHVELQKQKERSRSASKTTFGDWTVLDDSKNSTFLGYERLSCKCHMSKYRMATVKGKASAQIVLSETPFYAESGGQVGDQGWLIVGDEKIKVFDTRKENGEIIHYLAQLPKDLSGAVQAEVDATLRNETRKNHTATHLLHYALRRQLGDHVEQKGSLVAPDRLRFDFSHFQKISDAELSAIEQEVREMIERDLASNIREMKIDEAKALGAMALFGEKYGDQVRVVEFGPSVELCGGTHVDHLAEIGGFKLLAESSIASGVRRIEAITGGGYQAYVNERLALLQDIEDALGHPKDSIATIEKLQSEVKQSAKKIEAFIEKEKSAMLVSLRNDLTKIGSTSVLIKELEDLDPKSAKDIAYNLTLDQDATVVVLGGASEGKPFLVVALSKTLADEGKLDAGAIIRQLASHIDGGGGGQKFLATAGGKNAQGLRRALDHADEIIRIQAI